MLRFLPLFALLGSTISAIADNSGAGKMIAGLRKMKVNERIIMIFSITNFYNQISNLDIKSPAGYNIPVVYTAGI